VKLFAIPGSNPPIFEANIELNFALWDPGAGSGEQQCGCNEAAAHQVTPDSSIRLICRHHRG
jgi:hypothetical protein